MKRSFLPKTGITLVSVALLAACSGGVEDVSLPQSSGAVILAGVAAKGLIRNGSLEIYTPSGSGAPARLLGRTVTDGQGYYTVAISGYSGPVIIVANGSYTDEATGQTMTIDPAAPLHAVLPCTCSSPLVGAVTPLTELAYRKAGAAMTGGVDAATAFSAANAAVSALFSFDVIATQPVAPLPAVLSNAGNDQRNYTLALAGISQMMMESGSTVADVVAGLNSAGAAAADSVSGATVRFLNDNVRNQTGYKAVTLSLTLTGIPAAGAGALDMTLLLPAETALPADASGAVSPVNFTLTGEAATAFSRTNYGAATAAEPAKLRLAIISLNSLANGTFAVVRCAVPTPTPTSAFMVSGFSAVDENGVTIGGAGVSIQ